MDETDFYGLSSDSDVSSLPDGLSSDVHSLIEAEDATSNGVNANDDSDDGSENTRTASQAAKAIEAAEEHTPTDQPQEHIAGSSYESSVHLMRQTTWSDDGIVLDAGPAPPDYFAATAWRRASVATTTENRSPETTSQRDQDGTGHRTETREDGSPEVRSHTDIEAANPSAHEATPLLRQFKVRIWKRKGRVSGRLYCWCLIVGLIALAGLGVFFDLATMLQKDSPAATRSHASTHGDPWLDHPNTTDCDFDSFSEYVDIPVLDSSRFYLLEMIDFSGSDNFELEYTIASGSVEVIYVPVDAPILLRSPIVIRAHMATTLPWKVDIMENETFYRHKHAIHFQEPPLKRSNSSEPPISRPCLDTLILVYVREGTVIEEWDTRLFSLDFVDHEAASGNSLQQQPRSDMETSKLHISNRTEIFTEQGSVDLSFWSSNVTSIFTPGGSITGTYDFHTLMVLMTADDDIDVAINVITAKNVFPMYGRGSQSYKRMLQTTTFRGGTKVGVQSWPPPPETSQSPSAPGIEDILTSHLSTYGNIALQYTSDWSGSIMGRTRDGKMTIVGNGVEILPGSNLQTSRQIAARKGYGNGHLDFETWRGKSILRLGDS